MNYEINKPLSHEGHLYVYGLHETLTARVNGSCQMTNFWKKRNVLKFR